MLKQAGLMSLFEFPSSSGAGPPPAKDLTATAPLQQARQCWRTAAGFEDYVGSSTPTVAALLLVHWTRESSDVWNVGRKCGVSCRRFVPSACSSFTPPIPAALAHIETGRISRSC